MTVQDALNLAEGLTQLANESGIIVYQTFTSINDAGILSSISTQVNDVTLDYKLTANSRVTVLALENVVSIEGNVYNPGLVTYSGRKSIKKYIELAGGIKPNSVVSDIYLQRANGKIKRISRFNGIYTIAKPGDTITVPINDNPNEFDLTSFLADLATTLANIAAILVIVDNQND